MARRILGTATLAFLVIAVAVAAAGNSTPDRSAEPSGPNRPPILDGPEDGTRFDVEPGHETVFTVRARDPDGDHVTIRSTSTDEGGADIPRPAYVTCTGATVRMTCRVAPTEDAVAFLHVRAVDDRGAASDVRTYLVSGSLLTYVALGDSYAAGEGVEPFLGASRCHRSSRAYATEVRFPGSTRSAFELAGEEKQGWSFRACSGAGTGDIAGQIDHPDVNPGVDLVTISVGGNDIGFSQVLEACGAPPLRNHHCLDGSIDGRPFVTGLRRRIDALGPKLVRVYQDIEQKTFGAQLLVLGYPQLFPASEEDQRCPSLRLFDFTTAEQQALRAAGAELNATIAAAARRSGTTFVDIATAFDGHEVCGPDDEWINGVSAAARRWPPIDDESFHPKAIGQQQMAVVVNSTLSS